MCSPPDQAEAEPVGQDLRQVLAALADELERARSQCQALEATAAELLVQAGGNEGISAALQRFDATVQHLAVLRDFVGALSVAAGSSQQIRTREALDCLTLAIVRERLAGYVADRGDGPWEAV